MAVFVERFHFQSPVEHGAFTADYVLMETLQVRLALLRRDHGLGQRAPERLFPRPSESGLCLGVPVLDHAACVDRDEGVVRGIYDRARAHLVLTKGVLDLVAFGNILRGSQQSQRLAVIVADKVAFAVDHAHRAVRADDPVVESERLACAQAERDALLNRRTVVWMHSLQELLITRFDLLRLVAKNAIELV